MRWGRSRQRQKPAGQATVFFATDVHGSEVCFREIVAAANFYGADLLVLGGDVTGKLVVPVVESADGDGLVAELHGEPVSVPEADADSFERRIADEGLYAVRMSAAERGRAGARSGRGRSALPAADERAAGGLDGLRAGTPRGHHGAGRPPPATTTRRRSTP